MKWLKKVGRVLAAPVTYPVRAVQRKVERTMQAAIAGVVRHLITTVGGALVTSGVLSADDLSTLAGAGAIVVGVVWSLLNKKAAAATP